MIHLQVDLSHFRTLRDRTIHLLGGELPWVVFNGVEAGAAHARHTHPHQTRSGALTGPHLYARIVRSNPRGAVGEIVNDAPHARYVEYGTKPHVIRPKAGYGPIRALGKRGRRRDSHGKALRFIVGGRTVFASVVHHPGAVPMPFMLPAARFAAEYIIARTRSVTFVLAAKIWV